MKKGHVHGGRGCKHPSHVTSPMLAGVPGTQRNCTSRRRALETLRRKGRRKAWPVLSQSCRASESFSRADEPQCLSVPADRFKIERGSKKNDCSRKEKVSERTIMWTTGVSQVHARCSENFVYVSVFQCAIHCCTQGG